MLDSLSSVVGSRHKRKRLGRGRSSGHGGTSTKGHKGQRARSGFRLLRGFEGGQIPLVRSLPKFGWTNSRFKVRYNVLNVSDLESFDSAVDPDILFKAGLARKKLMVKILSQGQLTKPLKVSAHHFSQQAIVKIEKAGGSVTKLKPWTRANRWHKKKASLKGSAEPVAEQKVDEQVDSVNSEGSDK